MTPPRRLSDCSLSYAETTNKILYLKIFKFKMIFMTNEDIFKSHLSDLRGFICLRVGCCAIYTSSFNENRATVSCLHLPSSVPEITATKIIANKSFAYNSLTSLNNPVR
jgi:hypothetical protein